jgi:hypothetical protein
VYKALFLDPSHKKKIIHAYFTPTAARAMLRARAGVPPQAERVKMLVRKARIAVHARKGTQASVRVVVRARGFVGDKRFRVGHRSTLWLERGGDGWTAIAFDIDQRPIS